MSLVLPSRLPAGALWAAGIGVALSLAGAQEKGGILEAQPSAPAPPALSEESDGVPVRLDTMVPVGEVYEGVKVPSYEGDRKSSVMEAKTMRRVDREHLDIAGLVVRVYDLDTGEITTIVAEKALYDIPSKKLITRTRTRIEKQGQFEMEGDRLEFDTKARVGRMEGNVVTTLYNTEGSVINSDQSAPVALPAQSPPSSSSQPTPQTP